MEYQPLTLKTVKNVKGDTIKVGTLMRTARNSGGEAYETFKVTLVPFERSYRVFIQVDGHQWSAGRLYWHGVGRYGIATNHVVADEEGRLNSVRRQGQQFGYEERGTVAYLAERLVQEFLGDLEYTVDQYADEQSV